MLQLVFVFALCTTLTLANRLPSYFPKCDTQDPKFTKCIYAGAETLRPYFKKGIPEIGLPPMDPMVTEIFYTQRITDLANFKAKLIKPTVYGLTEFELKDYQYDPKTMELHLAAVFNSLVMESDFEVNGTIMGSHIQGAGNFNTTLGPTSVKIHLTGGLINRNGLEYYQPKQVKVKIGFTNSKSWYNMYGIDERLLRMANAIINQRSEQDLQVLAPFVEEVVEDLVFKLVVQMGKKVPLNSLE